MFCRSCWANLPNGTARCPKCQHDPRLAIPPLAVPAPLTESVPSPPLRELLDHLGQGEPMARALKEGLGLGTEDAVARLRAAGGWS
jgi:hypothetical protein